MVNCFELGTSSQQKEGREGYGLVEVLYGPEELLMKCSKNTVIICGQPMGPYDCWYNVHVCCHHVD